jgi:hypothetical protein
MNRNGASVALTDRAEQLDCLPKCLDLCALADDVLLDIVKWSADRPRYGLL